MFHFIYSFAFILIFIILKHKKIKSRVLFALFQNPRLNFINHFSKILDTHLIYIDDNVTSEIVLREPNTIKYSEYVYKYLTSLKSQDMISSEVFTQSILSL